MAINPDDPWYPQALARHEPCAAHSIIGCEVCAGVTIRLNLAAMAMQGITGNSAVGFTANLEIGECAFKMADAMIERANRDEGKHDEG